MLVPKSEPLEKLLRWVWEDNPKLHQDILIQFSMQEHGFNDRVGICSEFSLVMTGHGRLGSLKRMKDLYEQGDPSVKIPTNIEIDPVLGDWLIPCEDHVEQFESREAAYQYALIHNRASTAGLDLRDYDANKLQRAIRAASAGKQLGFEIPGFSNTDFADASTSLGVGTPQPGTPGSPPPIASVGQLPRDAVFDPASLPDAPIYQSNQVPQSFVVMVTAPDFAAFQKVLAILTLGERRTLPDNARFASVESGKYLAEWEKALVNKEALVIPAAPVAGNEDEPLPGQITLAGQVVEYKGQELSLGDLIHVTESPAVGVGTAVVTTATTVITEPAWDAQGNCLVCKGRGYTGARLVGQEVHKVYCTVCGGAGTQSVWNEVKGGSDDQG